ncbi:MAG: hypothetical protein F4X26_06125 [Chloroflexi bacterium]|nr:hypothetical protein [Chloroflexota bacterium]
MDANEHSDSSRLPSWLAAFVKRAFGASPDEAATLDHPPLRDEPGPSGLPPAPPRVEKRGL